MQSEVSISPKIIKQIEAGAYILSISFAEIACKIKLGKLEIDITPEKLFLEYSSVAQIDIIKIGVQEWLDSIELEWPDNRDTADRIITAFACKKRLAVVTTDKHIKKFYKNVVW
jgi:PIN domain nuclease of toxin-antitoxin system